MENSNKKTETMEINRNNAIKLWEQRYGKADEISDFAGRIMKKGAYDQRGSKFCWNIDHILPKSQGGKNGIDNLVCVHIVTNSEKADKFPSFVANDKTFEIRNDHAKWNIINVTNYQKDRIVAMRIWGNLYGDRTEIIDYAGRAIYQKNFAKDNSETGWNLDLFISDKGFNDDNVYIANIKTIEDRHNRLNFKANGINWSLRKSASVRKYEFLNEDILDVYNAQKVDRLIKEIDVKENFWCNLLIIKADFGYCKTDFVKFILQMSYGLDLQYYSFERTSSNNSEDLFILRFQTEEKNQVEEIYNFAILLNTYTPLLKERFGIDNIAIYNILHECDENDLYSPLDGLLTNKYSRNKEKISCEPFKYNRLDVSGLYVDANVLENISNKDGLCKCTTRFARDMYECTLIYTETEAVVNKLLDN